MCDSRVPLAGDQQETLHPAPGMSMTEQFVLQRIKSPDRRKAAIRDWARPNSDTHKSLS